MAKVLPTLRYVLMYGGPACKGLIPQASVYTQLVRILAADSSDILALVADTPT